MRTKPLLSDKQWSKIEPLLPNFSSKCRPWRNNRQVLKGILWVLRQVPDGAISPQNIPVPARAGEGLDSGKMMMSG